MTRSMTRWAVAGCTALAAMGAATVLDVGARTADAAPSVSPFAGTFVGNDPQGYRWDAWTITISDGGRISSSWPAAKGTISGRVDDDGSYSFTVSKSIVPIPNWRGTGPKLVTVKYDSAGTMALDADGNIVGTEETNSGTIHVGSFYWVRQ
jgi:hypothetical protein